MKNSDSKGSLLIATTNPGKLREFRDFLRDIPVRIYSLTDVGITDKPEENGTTYEENALIKARFYMEKTGCATIADDGGFEIDALGGEPGVKSHRWLNQGREDEDEEIITYTIKRMENVPPEKRTARLCVAVVFLVPGGDMHFGHGTVEGIVAEKPAPFRHPGFPFRSLLYLPEHRVFYIDNELPADLNRKLNHRKHAVEELMPRIRTYFSKKTK